MLCTIIAGFVRAVDGLNEWLGKTLAWLALGMVSVTFAVVVLRYGFNLGWIALQEAAIYMHALLFMLGAAYTLKYDAHVRVDIFYQRFGSKGRAWVDLLGAWLFLIPFCAFVVWSSWDYVLASWAIREGSHETGGLPLVFVLKSALLGFAGTLLLQGVAQSGKALLVLLDRSKS
ncbi:TRAP transporter small permease subunit [Methylothermus subterraneus]